jgi:hypothetical protein
MDITRADIERMENRLTERLEDGFDGMNRRLDTLNGRVGKGETTTAEHGVRLQNIERVVFSQQERHEHEETALKKRVDEGTSETKSITRRDVTVFLAGGGGVYAVIKVIQELIQAVRQIP